MGFGVFSVNDFVGRKLQIFVSFRLVDPGGMNRVNTNDRFPPLPVYGKCGDAGHFATRWHRGKRPDSGPAQAVAGGGFLILLTDTPAPVVPVDPDSVTSRKNFVATRRPAAILWPHASAGGPYSPTRAQVPAQAEGVCAGQRPDQGRHGLARAQRLHHAGP